MNARQALVCPACGVRNRPKWEFCAQCGESLEGAAVTTDTQAAEAAPAPSVSSASSVVVLGVTLVAVAVFAVMAWRHAREADPPSRPDPAMFTIATLPPSLPESPAEAAEPGSEAFQEGLRLSAAGDEDAARELFAQAVAADGSNAAYRAGLGRTLWALGQRQQALEQLEVAARLDPERQLFYARALDIAGDRTAAVDQYEEVLSRAEAPAVHEDLGRLLYRSGRYDEAVPHLEQAVEARSEDPVLKQEYAYALDAAGDAARATEVYREVLELAPGAAVSRGLLAERLFEDGQADEAMALLQEGLELTPDAPLLQRQLGSLLERSGQPAEAAAAYRRYAQLAPNAPDSKDLADRAGRLEKRGSKTP